MLNTLPSSYSYIGDLIDALPKEDQTVAYVKNKLEIDERKYEDENEARGTNAFTATRRLLQVRKRWVVSDISL